MAVINPYLNFNGNTEEAFEFYKSVFGGEFATVMRFAEAPPCPERGNVLVGDREKIMHVALPVGNSNVLMGTDALESMGQNLTRGNNFSVSVSTESKEETEKIFNGLSEGGKVSMPLAETFWSKYFGMCQDKFGIQWMVNWENK